MKETFRPNDKHRPRVDGDNEAWKIYCREETVNSNTENGNDRMDLWRAFAKEAVETPEKLATFTGLLREVREKHGSWDTFNGDKKENVVTRMRNKFVR